MIDDIRRASDEQMSFDDAIAEVRNYRNMFSCSHSENFSQIFQIDYTMGPPLHYDPYHNSIIQTTLTRNIASRFDDIHEEIECAFDENIFLKENGTLLCLTCYIIQMLVTSRMVVRPSSLDSHDRRM